MTDATAERAPVVDHEPFMRMAIAVARRGLLAGEPPVGACLVRDGEVLATTGNGVIGELDPTAHAEMRAIRQACAELRALTLPGCTLYVTVEPCAMCLTACHYAGIDGVVFGATLDDMHAVTGGELRLRHAELAAGGLAVAVAGGCLRADCRALLEEWSHGVAPRR